MEVIVAKSAGFCFGVRRAVQLVYEQLEKRGVNDVPVYTYGPIIHNEQVVAQLALRGVKIVESEQELAALTEGIIVIRSHGIGRALQEQLLGQGLEVVDATCPFVKKIHKIVSEAAAAGHRVVIVGDPDHPEVQGIRGWSGPHTHVVSTPQDIKALPADRKITIVSQTTFNNKKFQEIVEKLSETGYDRIVVNTICNATQERQGEAGKIAASVDAMIVIGGRHSSNTRKLYDICRAECDHTYFIQTLVDLDMDGFTPVRSVGITAGASTPNNIIEEVHSYVRSKL